MHKLSLALLILLAACGGSDDDASDDSCVFEGRYEMGFDPITPGCQAGSIEIPPAYVGYEEECFFELNDVAPNGVSFEVTFSCRPGDPVVECEGLASYSNGCAYNTHLRRISP